MSPRSLALLVFAVCVVGDQAAKRVATQWLGGKPAVELLGGIVRLERVENAGGFLSLGAGLPGGARWAVYVLGVGLGLALLAAYLLRRPMSAGKAAALALILGGASSNWIDRVTRGGTVVDFAQLRLGSLHTGVFNLADMAILAGASLLVWRARKPETPLER